ncbi:hypothetical protein E2605_08525 [Dysgonomonas capnocytophagoides]|uniref:Nuclease associated modular domain-containing protein n=1 Tax=Dysgonomonas capnocytophagoides TaxID=45254 RepID=A0A4Y8L452_9BACT|nr:NUMOD3 domain-containing DNA-binding protein [Dysgonomonas capnocytophagoides]TFD96848.1 hypothetical protein E2605_08525 [Dysgonomonas capnocytophagoides]
MKIIVTEDMAKRLFREASESTKTKMSIKKQGILNPNYGRKQSEETKQKISTKLKYYWKNIPNKPTDNENV